MSKFINESKAVTPDRATGRFIDYGFDHPSKYLFRWSRLFQATISQALTWALFGVFHDKCTGIYKSEGGCNVPGVGELVLWGRGLSWDMSSGSQQELDERLQKAAALINHVVLKFDPEDPVESILNAASESSGCSKDALLVVASKSFRFKGKVFQGDPLSSFFDWNPFSEPPKDEEYNEFVARKFSQGEK